MITGVPSKARYPPEGEAPSRDRPFGLVVPARSSKTNRTEGRQSALRALRALEVQSYWYGAGR
jgi:hypothetical protein